MAEIPKCRNSSCPRSQTFVLKESETEFVFGCMTCKGIEVRSKPAGWRAGLQNRRFREQGRPEWARERAYFDMARGRK